MKFCQENLATSYAPGISFLCYAKRKGMELEYRVRGRVWNLTASVWIFYIVYQLLTLHNSEAVIHNSLLRKHKAYQKMGLNIFCLKGLIIVSYSGLNNTEYRLYIFFVNIKMEYIQSEEWNVLSGGKKIHFVKRFPDFGSLSLWENNEDGDDL